MSTCKSVPAPSPWLMALAGVLVLSTVSIVTPVRGATPVELNDQAISDAVEDQIRRDFLVPVNRVDVITVDGIVTLDGVVANLMTKERAAQIAESVKGVRSVVNEVKVRPYLTRTPAQTKEGIEAALFANPATETYEVTVDVKEDGTAILSGTVESWPERELAEQVAKTVVGVTGVENKIEAKGASDRSESEIKAEMEERLRWNVLVDDGLIDVSLDGGEAFLKGTVGSAAEKREARRSAWVPGVSIVNASGLKVDRWARDEDLRNPENLDVKDQEIEAALQKALFYDPRVNSADVEVNSVRGVVGLRGQVRSLQAKRAAEQDAQNTVGVISVTNRLKVRPDMGLSDIDLARDVSDALARDAVTESWEIGVTATDGVVALTGTVDNYYEKSRADVVAGSVKGVEGVHNLLTVVDRSSPYTYDPYYDRWSPYGRDWYDYQPSISWKSDAEIKEAVKDELWWSPFVDSDEVTVSVENGVATLTGTVDSWAERNAARENALEGGAIWVVNDLELRQSGS